MKTLKGYVCWSRHAPLLVRFWAKLREQDGEDPAKVQEALSCAESMKDWAWAAGKMPMDPGLEASFYWSFGSGNGR